MSRLVFKISIAVPWASAKTSSRRRPRQRHEVLLWLAKVVMDGCHLGSASRETVQGMLLCWRRRARNPRFSNSRADHSHLTWARPRIHYCIIFDSLQCSLPLTTSISHPILPLSVSTNGLAKWQLVLPSAELPDPGLHLWFDAQSVKDVLGLCLRSARREVFDWYNRRGMHGPLLPQT